MVLWTRDWLPLVVVSSDSAVVSEGVVVVEIAAEICSHNFYVKKYEAKQKIDLSLFVASRKLEKINPCGENDQLIVHFSFQKMAERSEDKSSKRSFASNFKISYNLTRSVASRF